MKFLKICKLVKTKGHMTVKEVLSFWTTLERQDPMTQVLKVNQKAIQMMMILVLTRKATEIRRNSSKSILIISERFYVFINLFKYFNFSSRKHLFYKKLKKEKLSPTFWRHSFSLFVYFFTFLSFNKFHYFAIGCIVHVNFDLDTSLREIVCWIVIKLLIQIV